MSTAATTGSAARDHFDLSSPAYSETHASLARVVDDMVASLVRNSAADDSRVCSGHVSLHEIERRFACFAVPEEGMAAADYFARIHETAVVDEMVLQSPKNVGHMSGALPPWTAALGRLVTFLHANVVKTETAKSATAVERETIAMIHKELFDREEAFYARFSQDRNACLGHATCGGTTANLEALWLARNTALPGVEHKGLPAALRDGGYEDAVIICSELSHYSITLKAPAILGMGLGQVIKIPTTTRLRADTTAVRAALESCRASRRCVVAIVGVAGSTEAGSFDDLEELAGLAREYGTWFHVDAAWGGGLVFASSGRSTLLRGVHLANSVTLDAHKQLFTPMGFGMILYGDATCYKAIAKEAEYVIRGDSHDLGRFTLEGSRPAVAYYLHMNLFVLGRRALREVMDAKLATAQAVARVLAGCDDFDLLAEPESDILLFRYVPAELRRDGNAGLDEARETHLDQMQARLQEGLKSIGRGFLSRTAVRDPRWARGTKTAFLRCVVNAQSTAEDVLAVIDSLRLIAATFHAKALDAASSLLDGFCYWAVRTPKALAVTCEGASLSYEELFDAAHAVADTLTSPPGSTVAIVADRSVNAVVAVLGVLMQGCAWLLIDVALPPSRMAHMVAESEAAEALVAAPASGKAAIDAAMRARVAGRPLRVVDLSAEGFRAPRATTAGAQRAPVAITQESFAYVIFTSGSTGAPKGVRITHGQVLDLCRAFVSTWGCAMGTGDVASAQIAWSWDMHVLDIFMPLLQGATCGILSDADRLDGSRVATCLADARSVWCQGTPTFWRSVLSGGWHGLGCERLVCISSGEALAPALARHLLHRSKRLVNCYGLTEATIFQSFQEIALPASGGLPDVNCGKPAYAYGDDDHCRLIVLRGDGGDASPSALTVAAPGETGEICFAGSCLPRGGYMNDDALNLAKFAPNPTGWRVPGVADDLSATMLIRTGDMGSVRPSDGVLLVQGRRTDSMVKILGSRVDLSEVRHYLCTLVDYVQDAAVVTMEDAADTTHLVAYFVPTSMASAAAMETARRSHADEVQLWEAIYGARGAVGRGGEATGVQLTTRPRSGSLAGSRRGLRQAGCRRHGVGRRGRRRGRRLGALGRGSHHQLERLHQLLHGQALAQVHHRALGERHRRPVSRRLAQAHPGARLRQRHARLPRCPPAGGGGGVDGRHLLGGVCLRRAGLRVAALCPHQAQGAHPPPPHGRLLCPRAGGLL